MRVGIEQVRVMAQTVGHTLSILCLFFKEPSEEEVDESDQDCYIVVEAFFSSCLQIRCLGLDSFDFGDDPTYLTPTIMDGFRRLKSLGMIECRGNLMMIVEAALIQNLSYLTYFSPRSPSWIISAIVMKCRLLKSISLYANFQSWESIHRIVEYCRDLKKINNRDFFSYPLKKSEFDAIASLPRLKCLELKNCKIDDGAFP
jgi:hypothetical protein